MSFSQRLLTAAVWLVAGAGVGVVIRWANVRLAIMEGQEHGSEPSQVFGPPILTALLFAIFGFELGPHPVLLLRSLWIAVMVQVIFFDLEHRLILDRVLVPAMVVAIALSFVTPGLNWKVSIIAGLGAGLLFLLVAMVGAFLFKAEALGLGDVKLAVLIGLVLGFSRGFIATGAALIYGVVLAGLTSILLVALRRKTLKDSIAYGPYLAAGTLIVLFQQGAQ